MELEIEKGYYLDFTKIPKRSRFKKYREYFKGLCNRSLIYKEYDVERDVYIFYSKFNSYILYYCLRTLELQYLCNNLHFVYINDL